MSEKLVWLPFDPADLGDPPSGLRYEVVAGTDDLPGSVSDVAFYVPPYDMTRGAAGALASMAGLEVVQTLTAGVDHVRDSMPDGVTLCNGSGIHDTATAEQCVTLVLASLNLVPEFVRAQDERHWRSRWRRGLADRQVLLVGHGAIGQAIEARLSPFEVDVVRVARTARDTESGPVHGFDELPALLPDADVVVLIVPLTDETRGLVDAGFLSRMRDDALLVNVARGAVVDEDALLAELHAGRLHAAVDVAGEEPLPSSSPLWDAPGLLVSPHVGGMSPSMWPRAHRLVRDQLHRYASGEPLANVMTGAY